MHTMAVSSSRPAPITAATKLVSAANSDTLAATPTGTISVNGKSITFSTSQTTSTTDASGNVTLGTGTGSNLTVGDLLTAIRTADVTGKGESKYFKFACFKNGNIHLRFKRLDLLALFNQVAAGQNLPQAREKRRGTTAV